MKKMKSKILILLLALLLAALGATSALADGPPYPAEVSIGPISCTMLDAEGNPFIASALPHIVTASEKSGSVKFFCLADHPINVPLPDRTVFFDFENTGGLCSVGPGETTEDWMSLVTPSGKVMMVCHVHPSP